MSNNVFKLSITMFFLCFLISCSDGGQGNGKEESDSLSLQVSFDPSENVQGAEVVGPTQLRVRAIKGPGAAANTRINLYIASVPVISWSKLGEVVTDTNGVATFAFTPSRNRGSLARKIQARFESNGEDIRSVVLDFTQNTKLVSINLGIGNYTSLGLSYRLESDSERRFFRRDIVDLFRGEKVHLYFGKNYFGTALAFEGFNIFEIRKQNGESISRRAIENLIWINRILDYDQDYSDAFGAYAEDVGDLNFDIDHEQFINANNVRDIVRTHISAGRYIQSLTNGGRFENWSEDQIIDWIIGSQEEAKAFADAMLKNISISSYSDAQMLKSGFPFVSNELKAGNQRRAGTQYAVRVGKNSHEENFIAATGMYIGPVYVLNASGQLMAKGNQYDGFEFISLAKSADHGDLIASNTFWGVQKLSTSSMDMLPGWPKALGTYMFDAPHAFDVNQDGNDEIVTEHDRSIGGVAIFQLDGSKLLEYKPVDTGGWYEDRYFSPIPVDFNKDSIVDFVTTGDNSRGTYVFSQSGLEIDRFHGEGCFVIGDVTGDGEYECIGVMRDHQADVLAYFVLRGADGGVRKLPLDKNLGSAGGTFVLGDISGDGVPELITQTDTMISVLSLLNNELKLVDGWPQNAGVWGDFYEGTGGFGDFLAPLVADINGDGKQDIVAIFRSAWDDSHYLTAYSSDGALIANFPIKLNGFSRPGVLSQLAAPAIADLDKNGKNEIIVGGFDGEHALVVYAYEIPDASLGKIEWGQEGGDKAATRVYPIGGRH